jgi:hypothetical protein
MKKNTKNLDLKCFKILYKIFNHIFIFLFSRKITHIKSRANLVVKKSAIPTPDLYKKKTYIHILKVL